VLDTTDKRLIRYKIPLNQECLNADLCLPENATGLVIFAHGSGSNRLSPRNQTTARTLQNAGFATLLVDLLTENEASIDNYSSAYRFDIILLAERLMTCCDWIKNEHIVHGLSLGLFGASTGAAAALVAASVMGDKISAIVSRGGRPDLAGESLGRVKAPTLLIVGSLDTEVIALNLKAQSALTNLNKLVIIEGVSHLFPEPGAMEQVGKLTSQWFGTYLNTTS